MSDRKQYFSWHFKLKQEKCNKPQILLDIPGVVMCRIRAIGSGSVPEKFEDRENYPGRTRGRGDDLALEATLRLTSDFHPDWQECSFGVPLSELNSDDTFTLHYSGASFALLANGRRITDNLPYGTLPGVLPESCTPLSDAVCCSRWSKEPVREEKYEATVTSLHTWAPPGLNAWAGDVSLLYENGTFHLFYLYDRRHHSSKFGKGGHQWGHLASKDLRTWQDHGVVLPLYEDYHTYGTGTPFMMDGKLVLAYGFHTHRIIPKEVIAQHPDRYLSGATWAESTDGGKTFKPSEKVFHPAENPSIYRLDNGRFLYHDGTNILEGANFPEFSLKKEHIFPANEDSIMRNCRDCPAWFSWHDKHFMLLGFTGMWMDDAYDFPHPRDLAAEALDLYDGIQVPMVAPFGNDRRIMAGWLPVTGWAGVLLLRELVWDEENQVPGSRFLEEALPDLPCMALPDDADIEPNSFFETECRGGENLLIRLDGPGGALEFKVDAAAERASLAPAENSGKVYSQRENAAKGMRSFVDENGGMAREKIPGLDRPFKIRMLLRYERKWNGSIVDFEIGACRTMIGYFNARQINHVSVKRG